MKKLIAILAVLLLLAGMSISAYAQSEPIIGMGNPGDPPHQTINNPTDTQGEPVEKEEKETLLIEDNEISLIENSIGADTSASNNDNDSSTDSILTAEERAALALREADEYLPYTLEEEELLAEHDAPGGIVPIGMNGNSSWLWLLALVFIAVMGMVVFLNRTRLIPALQTNNGNVVAEKAIISRKQTIAAVKNSTVTPSNNAFNAIMEKIKDTEDNIKSN